MAKTTTKIIYPNGEIEFGSNNEKAYQNSTVRKIIKQMEKTKKTESFEFGQHYLHAVHTINGTYLIIITKKEDETTQQTSQVVCPTNS